jgi:hypothetical protein
MPCGIGWWPPGRAFDLRPARFACWVMTKFPSGERAEAAGDDRCARSPSPRPLTLLHSGGRRSLAGHHVHRGSDQSRYELVIVRQLFAHKCQRASDQRHAPGPARRDPRGLSLLSYHRRRSRPRRCRPSRRCSWRAVCNKTSTGRRSIELRERRVEQLHGPCRLLKHGSEKRHEAPSSPAFPVLTIIAKAMSGSR